MPPVKYDFWRGDHNLISPTLCDVDTGIRDFVVRFAAANQSTRDEIRARIKMKEFYELLTCSRRMAVFALRTADVEDVRVALFAIAVIDKRRIDYRDALMALSLLHHAAERNGMSAYSLFAEASALADPNTAELVMGFARSSPEQRALRRSWGQDEVRTASGLGFIGWGFHAYQPTYDLKQVAIAVADVVAADRYQTSSIQVATALPAVWFPPQTPAQQQRLDSVLQAVTAGATVSGKLRPGNHARTDAQSLTIFVIECSSADDSALLEALSREQSERYASVSISHGRLFSLAVARSFIAEIEGYETPQMLERFRQPLAAVLRRAVL
jgi:hypothetical protein